MSFHLRLVFRGGKKGNGISQLDMFGWEDNVTIRATH